MSQYRPVKVSESKLENLVRQAPELIEEGLKHMDHQKRSAGGRLDMLLVDSGGALVVAELKVVEDDWMLVQGIDYYDYVTANLQGLARACPPHGLEPSRTRVNRNSAISSLHNPAATATPPHAGLSCAPPSGQAQGEGWGGVNASNLSSRRRTIKNVCATIQ